MAWYVDPNGRQVWVVADETVYTITAAADDLPVHTLTYLAVKATKAVYTEHAVDDDLGDNKKNKKDMGGRQRGFIVRVDNKDDCDVISCFQAVAKKLIADGIVAHIDADEGPTERKRKKRGQKKTEDTEEAEIEQIKRIDLSTLCDNECRVETIARCTHNARGPGFRVEVAESGHRQVLHMFTDKKEIPLLDWMSHISDAVRSTGFRAMDCRVPAALVPTDAHGKTLEGGEAGQRRFNETQAASEENDWLSSMMGLSVSGYPEKDSGGPASGEAEKPKEKEKEKEQIDLPPWLRVRTRRPKAAEAG
jgi:hypothetical protein